MTATTIGTILLTSQVALGGLFPCKLFDKGSPCGPCRTSHPVVHREVSVLLHCPNGKDRASAAVSLRKVDWKCHPEVVPALAHAMLHDCEAKVRAKSAETLAKLAPCLPEAHSALILASQRDPNHGTRKWAKKALGNLDRGCLAACTHCGPLPGGIVSIGQPLPVFDVLPTPVPGPPTDDPLGELLPPGGQVVPSLPPGHSSLRPVYPEDSTEMAPRLEPPVPDPVLPRTFPIEPPFELVPPALPPDSSGDSPFLVPPEATHRPSPGRPQPMAPANRARFTSLLGSLGNR
ncbi:hypothetical protein BH23PLA1_BH23PLA1_18090 [soil metagenome]